MDWLSSLLTPAVVWLVTYLVPIVKKDVPSWVITTFIVPVLSTLTTVVMQALGHAPNFALNLLLGLAATFLHEFLKNIESALTGTAASVKP